MKTITLLSLFVLTSLNVIAGRNELVVYSKDLADGKTLKVFRSSALLPPSPGSENETKTNWLDDYSIIIQDGTNQTEVPYGSMTKWRGGTWDNIKFIDVQYKGRSGEFLYTCGNGAADERLYVTLTGNPPVVAEAVLSEKIKPSSLSGSGVRVEAPPPSDGVAGERQLWTADQGANGELGHARIIGSQSESNLVIEVPYVQANHTNIQTHSLVNGKWSVTQ